MDQLVAPFLCIAAVTTLWSIWHTIQIGKIKHRLEVQQRTLLNDIENLWILAKDHKHFIGELQDDIYKNKLVARLKQLEASFEEAMAKGTHARVSDVEKAIASLLRELGQWNILNRVRTLESRTEKLFGETSTLRPTQAGQAKQMSDDRHTFTEWLRKLEGQIETLQKENRVTRISMEAVQKWVQDHDASLKRLHDACSLLNPEKVKVLYERVDTIDAVAKTLQVQVSRVQEAVTGGVYKADRETIGEFIKTKMKELHALIDRVDESTAKRLTKLEAKDQTPETVSVHKADSETISGFIKTKVKELQDRLSKLECSALVQQVPAEKGLNFWQLLNDHDRWLKILDKRITELDGLNRRVDNSTSDRLGKLEEQVGLLESVKANQKPLDDNIEDIRRHITNLNSATDGLFRRMDYVQKGTFSLDRTADNVFKDLDKDVDALRIKMEAEVHHLKQEMLTKFEKVWKTVDGIDQRTRGTTAEAPAVVKGSMEIPGNLKNALNVLKENGGEAGLEVAAQEATSVPAEEINLGDMFIQTYRGMVGSPFQVCLVCEQTTPSSTHCFVMYIRSDQMEVRFEQAAKKVLRRMTPVTEWEYVLDNSTPAILLKTALGSDRLLLNIQSQALLGLANAIATGRNSLKGVKK